MFIENLGAAETETLSWSRASTNVLSGQHLIFFGGIETRRLGSHSGMQAALIQAQIPNPIMMMKATTIRAIDLRESILNQL